MSSWSSALLRARRFPKRSTIVKNSFDSTSQRIGAVAHFRYVFPSYLSISGMNMDQPNCGILVSFNSPNAKNGSTHLRNRQVFCTNALRERQAIILSPSRPRGKKINCWKFWLILGGRSKLVAESRPQKKILVSQLARWSTRLRGSPVVEGCFGKNRQGKLTVWDTKPSKLPIYCLLPQRLSIWRVYVERACFTLHQLLLLGYDSRVRDKSVPGSKTAKHLNGIERVLKAAIQHRPRQNRVLH